MKQSNPDPCELAEIIHHRPLSGEFSEVVFGSDREIMLWVKFSDKDGAGEWIGKFGGGGHGGGNLAKFSEPDQFVISAGNFAYLVDATRRELICQYHNAKALEIIFDSKRKALILSDYTDLQWVDFDGKYLFSQTVSVDGISDLKIDGKILSGLAYKNYENEQRFWFDLEQLKIIRWEKSWWKFW